MKTIVVISSLMLLVSTCALAEDQATLDAACEQAREAQLAPMREQMTADCIAEGKMDKKQCEAEYANHSGRTGNRQLPYYDLPECEKAFQNRKGTSRR
mgnify:CR=1 FL=1